MTLGDILLGLLVTLGFFVAAGVSRIFRRTATGVILGGVCGIAVSVTVLAYGLQSMASEIIGLDAPDLQSSDFS